MNTDETQKILREWEIKVKAFRQNIGVMSALLKEEAITPLYDLETEYTKAIAALVGDDEGWLDWFSNENDFGEEALVATKKCGKLIKVISIDDILQFIQSEE